MTPQAALAAILKEATIANDVIRLKRDKSGQGRIKVATAMHRIAAIAAAALPPENTKIT